MYITNGQRKDGFGAQLLNLIWDIIFAEEYGNEFVYSDIDSIEHNYDNDPNYINKLIEYTNIKKHYLTFNKIKKLQPLYQHVHYAMRDFIEADIERYYTGESFKRFKKNFLENKINPYSPSFINVAVHIRRPNKVDPEGTKGTNLADGYYLQLINAIRAYSSKEKPFLFHIYSQGDLAKFTEYKAPDVIFHLDTDLCDTFTGLVFGDILVTSASALSYCAALLSSGTVYYVKFWHPPMKHWTVIG